MTKTKSLFVEATFVISGLSLGNLRIRTMRIRVTYLLFVFLVALVVAVWAEGSRADEDGFYLVEEEQNDKSMRAPVVDAGNLSGRDVEPHLHGRRHRDLLFFDLCLDPVSKQGLVVIPRRSASRDTFPCLFSKKKQYTC